VALTQDLPLDLPTFTPPEDDLDYLDGTLLHSSVETIWADGVLDNGVHIIEVPIALNVEEWD
jgi:hypothetical protein